MQGSACDTVYTGTNEVAGGKSEIKIFPNPNNGAFPIVLPTGQEADWNLEIFDLSGRSRWQAKAFTTNVQVSNLPAGFYILVCRNSDGREVSLRLIIQH